MTLKEIANNIINRRIGWAMEKLDTEARKSNSTVVLEDYFDELALDIVAEAAFKQIVISGTDVAKQFRIVSERSGLGPLMLLPFGDRIPVSSNRLRQAAVKELRKAADTIIHLCRQDAMVPHSPGTELQRSKARVLVDLLVQDLALTPEMISDHSVTFLFAGHETTSKGLAWTSYCLAKHPEEQELLYEELCSVFAANTIPTLDDVKDLPQLNGVIKESLRLFPPVPIVFRSAVEDDVLPYSGAFIPKGQTVGISTFVVHRMEQFWGTDADDFKPSRWTDGTLEKQTAATSAFIPFLNGKRNCIGKDFAMHELLLTVAVLVRRFKISWPEGEKEPYRTMLITMKPKEKMNFEVHLRTQ
jgi:cytochrome P450